jgi:hypothetical protein
VATHLISPAPAAGFDFDRSLLDTGGEFADRYAIGPEGRMVLVRPDMYIGLSTTLQDAARLPEYLGYWYRETARA